jgi:hypothetical protein
MWIAEMDASDCSGQQAAFMYALPIPRNTGIKRRCIMT